MVVGRVEHELVLTDPIKGRHAHTIAQPVSYSRCFVVASGGREAEDPAQETSSDHSSEDEDQPCAPEQVRGCGGNCSTIPDGGFVEWCTTMDLWPVTGRKHQLRIHMRGIGHPIIGDKKYSRHVHVHRQPKGLLLASCVAEFTHPITEEPLRIECEEPAMFETAREALHAGWTRQVAYKEQLNS